MKLPNGYGSITKLSGNRRRPFVVRITDNVEYNKETKKANQTRVVLGYYASKKEANLALANYNTNPFDLKNKDITFKEVYELWLEKHFKVKKLSDKTKDSYVTAYKHCVAIYDEKFLDLRSDNLQNIVTGSNRGYSMQSIIKSLIYQMYEYAMENDLVFKNYAQYIILCEKEKKLNREIFSDDELIKLWDNIDRMEYIDTVLILIYSGMRIGELLEMQSRNVDLKEKTMKIVRAKNKSSLRSVPIHDKILPLVTKYYELGKEVLIPNTVGTIFGYSNYKQKKFDNIMKQLGMEHNPHDARHTFASRADTYGLNKLCIKRILGHESDDITDKVYTHKDIIELLIEINKIP
jgi:integrase